MLKCYYALGGINYKNGVITTCPRQSDQLVYTHETVLPSEIFNHQNFRNLRELLYQDKWPSGCDTCEDMERDNLISMRKDYLPIDGWFHKSHGGTTELNRESCNTPLLKCYDKNNHKTDFKGLRHLELRFSTACNFACLHCSKVYSSGWITKLLNYKPDKEVHQYDLRQLLGTEHRHGPNDKNEMSLSTEDALKIIDDLNENFPYLEYIDFSGGELLYQKQFFPTLKGLAEHPNAKNMNISFHSNFNSPNLDVLKLSELLAPFKSSSIIISIDAGRKMYPYFRNGGDWEKLKQNIYNFKKENKHTYLSASITTSIYQMLDLYDIFDSILDLYPPTDKPNSEIQFNASIVQTPKYINPSLIMYDFAEETEHDIKKTYELIEKKDMTGNILYERQAKIWLDYILHYVKNTKISYNNFNRFLIYRKKSDEIWGQNFNDYYDNYQIENNELVRVK